MKKLNLGSGANYRKGWVNLDYNKTVRADVYSDIDSRLPFKDNTFDYILADHILEHTKNIFFTMDELWRISKPKGIIDIYVPFHLGVYAWKHLPHKRAFGVGSFDMLCEDGLNIHKEVESGGRFKLLDEQLMFINHKSIYLDWLYKIFPNFIFNFNREWRLFCERFLPIRFDEIYFKLEVMK